MTKENFQKLWTSNYPNTIPISHLFKQVFSDRWFRIHSLPESKRYAENNNEWNTLLDRQNKIITDLLTGYPTFLLVTGAYTSEGLIELHPLDEVPSIEELTFTSLEPIDLNEISPNVYEQGQMYTPMFSVQNWKAKKFDNLLKDIANDNIKAFFLSEDKDLIIAPYDGGVDIILKDTETRDFYKQKYGGWLSERQDGL